MDGKNADELVQLAYLPGWANGQPLLLSTLGGLIGTATKEIRAVDLQGADTVCNTMFVMLAIVATSYIEVKKSTDLSGRREFYGYQHLKNAELNTTKSICTKIHGGARPPYFSIIYSPRRVRIFR